jgi:hypothetical protein
MNIETALGVEAVSFLVLAKASAKKIRAKNPMQPFSKGCKRPKIDKYD